MTPTETVLAWIEQLSPKLRDELTFHVAGLFPGPHATTMTRRAELLLQELRAATADPLRNAGTALSLVAVIDFVLVSRASTSVEVAEAQNLNLRAAAHLDEEGDPDLADDLRANAASLEFRGKQWAQAKESWATLQRGPLAVASIDDWLRRALEALVT